MTNPVYTLGIELAVGSLTNLASLCLRASFSRSVSDLFTGLSADPAQFELSNQVGSLSPLLNTNLVPGRKVAFTATYGGSSYNLYAGRIKRFSTRPMLGERTTVIEALTEVDRVSRTLLNTGMFARYNAGSLFTEIMSRSSVASFAADAFTDTVDFAWYQDRQAAGAVDDLVRGGYYQSFVDGAGTFHLKNRYFGNFVTATDTITAGEDVSYRLDDSRVLNSVKVRASPRQQISGVSTVAYMPNPVTIPGSSGAGFFVSYFDPRNVANDTPCGSVITPVASTDFYAAANSDGTGSNLTANLSLQFTSFGASAVASFWNGNATTAYLSRFQVRGYPVLQGADINLNFDDSSSQTVYGIGAITVDNLITNPAYLRDLGMALVGERKNPRDALDWTLKNEFPGVLTYDVGNLLSVIHSLAGVNSGWQVRAMQHEISLAAGLEHRATYTLEAFTVRPWLVLDHATFGKLDSGRQLAL